MMEQKKSKLSGPCTATNPIDRCWRCRQDWATDRKRLARCAKGFGRNTTGGLAGKFYVVTDGTDDDVVNPRPGTLRWGVIQIEPLWITFAKTMIITLKEELIIRGDKTIDGRGAQVRIANGAQLTVQFVNNVIIHNIHINDIVSSNKNGGYVRDSADHFGWRIVSDGDGVTVFGSTNVWLDHLSLSNCQDGLIDVIAKSTGVTISNCHLTNHNDVMLFSSSDKHPEDQVMQITVAFNHFGRGLVQRMPRCRWGFFHVVNNESTTTRTGSCTPSAAARPPPSSARATATSRRPTSRPSRSPSSTTRRSRSGRTGRGTRRTTSSWRAPTSPSPPARSTGS
jgi:pectate lyase